MGLIKAKYLEVKRFCVSDVVFVDRYLACFAVCGTDVDLAATPAISHANHRQEHHVNPELTPRRGFYCCLHLKTVPLNSLVCSPGPLESVTSRFTTTVIHNYSGSRVQFPA